MTLPSGPNDNKDDDSILHGLDDVLAQADPVAQHCLDDGNWDMDAACRRISSKSNIYGEFGTQKTAVTLSGEVLAGSSTEPHWRRRFSWHGAVLSAAASIAVLVSLVYVVSGWPTDVDNVPKTVTSMTPKTKKRPLVDAMPEVKSRSRIPITTVAQILKLPRRKRIYALKTADGNALKEELGQWMDRWAEASPTRRLQMRGTWQKNREYWLRWTQASALSWKKLNRSKTSVDILVAEFGTGAKSWLHQAKQKAGLREICDQYLLPMLNDRELIAVAKDSKSCPELQFAVDQLVQRGSSQATEALVQLAGTENCNGSLWITSQIWNPIHVKRLVADLSASNKQRRSAIVSLFMLSPDPSVDEIIARRIEGGVGRLESIAILLLRDSTLAKQTLKNVRNNQSMATYLASSQRLASRWKNPSLAYSFLPPEVCRSCELY